jgi:hypothetical protein
MVPYMEMCAQEGFVDLLKENIDYFKIDLCCEMLNLMKTNGIGKSVYNTAYQFDHKINSAIKIFTKNYLIQAHRVLLQRKNVFKKRK